MDFFLNYYGTIETEMPRLKKHMEYLIETENKGLAIYK